MNESDMKSNKLFFFANLYRIQNQLSNNQLASYCHSQGWKQKVDPLVSKLTGKFRATVTVKLFQEHLFHSAIIQIFLQGNYCRFLRQQPAKIAEVEGNFFPLFFLKSSSKKQLPLPLTRDNSRAIHFLITVIYSNNTSLWTWKRKFLLVFFTVRFLQVDPQGDQNQKAREIVKIGIEIAILRKMLATDFGFFPPRNLPGPVITVTASTVSSTS